MKRMEIQVVYIYMHGGEKGAKSNKARKTKLVLKGVAICVVRASHCCCKGMPTDSMEIVAAVFKGEKQRRQEQKNNEDQSVEKCERESQICKNVC